MSKFICLSCHKEFKVAVRAPMSCPTKHLCHVVQSESVIAPLSPPAVTQPLPDSGVTNVIRDDCSVPLPPLPPRPASLRPTAALPDPADRKTVALPPSPSPTPTNPPFIKRQTAVLPVLSSMPAVPFTAALVETVQPPAVYPSAQNKPPVASTVPVQIASKPIVAAPPPPSVASPDSESFALDEFVSNSSTTTARRSPPVSAPPLQPTAASAVHPVGNPPAVLIVEGFPFPIIHGNILGREGDIARDLFRKDKTVGRIHARVDITAKNEIAIRNLAHSGNPVIIDGHPLTFNHTAILSPGLHQIQLGTRFLCSINVGSVANQK